MRIIINLYVQQGSHPLIQSFLSDIMAKFHELDTGALQYIFQGNIRRTEQAASHFHFLFLFWFLVQFVGNMQQTVGGDDVVEGLGAALRVDGAAHVAEIAEQVEAVEHDDQIAFHETLG